MCDSTDVSCKGGSNVVAELSLIRKNRKSSNLVQDHIGHVVRISVSAYRC